MSGVEANLEAATAGRVLWTLRKAQEKLLAVERARREPIAIVGIGCRFPGGADEPESFWAMLSQGVEAISDLPAGRFDVDRYYHPEPGRPGCISFRRGGFLRDVESFDAAYFGISPREARDMDPQHRLLLEVSTEALQRAALGPAQLRGSRTGVFVGITQNDYGRRFLRHDHPERITVYSGTGNLFAFAAGRISHTLGLRGPSLAVDTACSSSLVAVHLACQSLRSRESDVCIAGGSHLVLGPEISIFLSQSRAVSPDGRCRPFDAAASGFNRGEGCGIVVLRRLSDALAERHSIVALIRGSSVNHDGESGGLTVPSEAAQRQVITEALQNAGVDPAHVGYVEAHGTGTKLGDPIELSALRAALCARRTNEQPLWVGSTKANIGHLEAAAGVTGLIKAALALEARQLPPQVNFTEPSPHIQWSDPPVRVARRVEPFPEYAGQRIAGVSALGLSGTNAHVILAEPPDSTHAFAEAASPLAEGSAGTFIEDAQIATGLDGQVYLLPISARSRAAVDALSFRYARWLGRQQRPDLASFCYTAAIGRAHLKHRRCILARSGAEIVAGLHGTGGNTGVPDARIAERFEGEELTAPRVGLLVSPLLPVVPSVAAALRTHPAYRRALDAWPVLDDPEAHASTHRRARSTAVAEAFRHCHAMVALAQSWGVSPVALAGAGNGGALAAHLAGMLSAPAAAALASGSGAPAPALVRARLPLVGCGEVLARLQAGGTIEPTPGALEAALHALRAQGAPWVLLVGAGCLRLIGPSEAASALALPGTEDAPFEAMRALGWLYVKGATIDWSAVYDGTVLRRLALPTYPFERQRHWARVGSSANEGVLESTRATGPPPGHSLWGREMPLPGSTERRFETTLSWTQPPWLSQHVIFGQVVVPGALSLSLLVEAARACFGRQPIALENVRWSRALCVRTPLGVEVQVIALPEGEHVALKLMARSADVGTSAWQLYASARACVASLPDDGAPTMSAPLSLSAIRGRCTQPDSPERLYAALEQVGARPGLSFRWHAELFRSTDEILCRMRPPDTEANALPGDEVALEARLIDSCFQLLAVTAPGQPPLRGVPAPVSVRRVRVIQPGAHRYRVFCHVADIGTGSFRLLNDAAEVLAEVDGVSFRELTAECGFSLPEAEGRASQARRASVETSQAAACLGPPALYQAVWLERSHSVGSKSWQRRRWLLISDTASAAASLARAIQWQGDRVAQWTLSSTSPSPEVQAVSLESLQEGIAVWLALERGAAPGVVYLSGLNGPSADASSAEALEASVERCCCTALDIIQALAARANGAQPSLWIVTRGARAVTAGARVPGLARAALWGLATAVPMEEERLVCSLVDLDPLGGELSQREAEQIAIELPLGGTEGAVALRGTSRFVERLVTRPMPQQEESLLIHAQATYLITGGLGGLGLELAQLLVARGARHLVLASRSGASAQARPTLEYLRQCGASVTCASVDVTHPSAIDTLLGRIRREMPPLRGVVHAAGVVEDALLRTQSRPSLGRVLSPKVSGAWNLHQRTQGDTLSFFVLLSSLASLCGSPGQGAYAAANAFLDALAHHRRERGLAALSVNFGAWARVGMAARQTQAEASERATWGLGAMAPEAALDTLWQLMGTDVDQVGVAHLDTDKLLSTASPYRLLPLCEFLASAAPSRKPALSDGTPAFAEPERPRGAAWLRELSALPLSSRSKRLFEHVRMRLSQTLNMGSADAIDPELPLVELGVDSLMGVELSNRLGADLGWRLPSTLVFDCPTLASLAAELLAKLDAAGPDVGVPATPAPMGAPERATVAPVATPVPQRTSRQQDRGDWDRLSDEELGSLVDEIVARGK